MKKFFAILTSLVVPIGMMTAQAGTYTMNVDNPDKVVVTDMTTYKEFTPKQGEAEYTFNDGEKILINESYGSAPLYRVTVDGADQDMDYSYGGYLISLEDGMYIDVQANYPDIDYTITFEYEGDSFGFWKSAQIGGMTVDSFDGYSLVAKFGTYVDLVPDTERFPDATVSVNGTLQYWPELNLFMDQDYIVTVSSESPVTPPDNNFISFTLYVDNPEAVTISNGATVFNNLLPNEPNNLDLPYEDQYLTVTANEGYRIVKIYENEYSEKTSPVWITGGMTLYITTETIQHGGTYTMTVDNPSKVEVYNSGDWYSAMEISEGTHTYSFNPGEYLMIIPSNSDTRLYKVLVDGNIIEDTYGSYDIMLSDGMNIEIFADFPDKECNITLNYDAGAKGFWKSAKINGVEKDDFNGMSFKVMSGSSVSLTGDMIGYSNISVNVNGEEDLYFKGTLDLFVVDDVTIAVSAERAEIYDFTLFIDNVNAVKVSRGDDDILEGLLSGNEPNALIISAENPYIYVTASVGYEIESIKDGQGRTYQSPVRVDDGMELYITTKELPLDNIAVFYLDRKFEDYFFNCSLNMGPGNRKVIDIQEGYNIINFSDEYNNLFTNWMSPVGVNYLFLNGVRQNGFYDAVDNYSLELKEGDVIKVFIAEEPEKVFVSISAGEDVGPEISVTRDIITSVENWRNMSEEVFTGTMYTFVGEGIEITLNGEIIPTEEGVCKVAVSESYNEIKVSQGTTCISGVDFSNDNEDAVYNLHGIKVGKKSEINNLPTGIYVSDGKKIIVK